MIMSHDRALMITINTHAHEFNSSMARSVAELAIETRDEFNVRIKNILYSTAFDFEQSLMLISLVHHCKVRCVFASISLSMSFAFLSSLAVLAGVTLVRL